MLVYIQRVCPPDPREVEHQPRKVVEAYLLDELALIQVLGNPGELVSALQEPAEGHEVTQVDRGVADS